MNTAAMLELLVRDPLWIPLAAYLLGSIPFGLLLVRLRAGRDIRRLGSGNIGAANVAREAGLATGVATLLLDAAKGYFPVWIAAHFTQGNIHWMMYAVLAAILGHLFPVWLRFRGGRGVATAAGAFLGICSPAVALAFSVWLLVLWFWGYASLASISAAAAMPLLMYMLYAPRHAPPEVVSFGTLLASVLVIVRHAPNIRRLLSGTEPPFSRRKPKE